MSGRQTDMARDLMLRTLDIGSSGGQTDAPGQANFRRLVPIADTATRGVTRCQEVGHGQVQELTGTAERECQQWSILNAGR